MHDLVGWCVGFDPNLPTWLAGRWPSVETNKRMLETRDGNMSLKVVSTIFGIFAAAVGIAGAAVKLRGDCGDVPLVSCVYARISGSETLRHVEIERLESELLQIRRFNEELHSTIDSVRADRLAARRGTERTMVILDRILAKSRAHSDRTLGLKMENCAHTLENIVLKLNGLLDHDASELSLLGKERDQITIAVSYLATIAGEAKRDKGTAGGVTITTGVRQAIDKKRQDATESVTKAGALVRQANYRKAEIDQKFADMNFAISSCES